MTANLHGPKVVIPFDDIPSDPFEPLWPIKLNQETFFVFGTFNLANGALRVPAVHYALGWCPVHEALELNIDISNMQEDSHNGDFF